MASAADPPDGQRSATRAASTDDVVSCAVVPTLRLRHLVFRHLVVAALLFAPTAGCESAPQGDAARTSSARAELENDEAEDELRVELLEMMRQDQQERTGEGLPAGTRLPPVRDYARATRLAEIVDEVGWPTHDMVGVEGGTAAWLIAQHADHDVALQRHWLDLMTEAAKADQADPLEVAYLHDRVAVNAGEPQRYGTQIRCRDGVPAPATPIEDEPGVDDRRRAVGLDALADYYDELSMMCEQEGAEGQGPLD